MFISTDLPSSHYIEKLMELREKLLRIKEKVDAIGSESILTNSLLDLIETGDEHLINQYIDSL